MDIFKDILDNSIGTFSDLTTRPNLVTECYNLIPIIKQVLEFFGNLNIQITLSGGFVNFLLGQSKEFGDVDFFINNNSNIDINEFRLLATILNTEINIQYYPLQSNRYCLIPIHSIYSAILANQTQFQFIFIHNIPRITHIQSFAYHVISSFDLCFLQKALVLAGNQLRLISLPNVSILNTDYIIGLPLMCGKHPQVTNVFKKTVLRLAKHFGRVSCNAEFRIVIRNDETLKIEISNSDHCMFCEYETRSLMQAAVKNIYDCLKKAGHFVPVNQTLELRHRCIKPNLD